MYCLSVCDRYVYCLSEADSLCTGMCIVCQGQTVSRQECILSVSMRQVCVLSVRIRQFLKRYVYCLSVSDTFWTGMCIVSVSDSFWTGMCIICQNQTVSG